MNNVKDYCNTSGEHGHVLTRWLDFSVIGTMNSLQSNLRFCVDLQYMCEQFHLTETLSNVPAGFIM